MRTTIAAGIAAISLGVAAATAEPLKIGMITTLSGGGAGLGIDVRDGFMLALEQSGNTEIEVIVEDDAQKPELAVQIADKMLQSDQVDILTGIIWSNLAMAVVPSAIAQGTIYISPNAGPSALAGAGCDANYFNVAWQNDNLHEGAGNYAMTDGGYENVFILAPNYPAGTDALTGFKRFYTGELAGELYTRVGQTDYAAEIAEIRASGADAVYFFLPGGMGISFMKQYDQSAVDIPVIGTAFTFDQDTLPAIGDAALGVKNASHWSKDIDNPVNKAFVETFQAEYGRLPSAYASQGFDAANLILAALETSGISDREAFLAALKEADFDSVRGTFQFGPNNHPIQDIYVREVIKEGDVLTNRIIGIGLENHQDAYAADCDM